MGCSQSGDVNMVSIPSKQQQKQKPQSKPMSSSGQFRFDPLPGSQNAISNIIDEPPTVPNYDPNRVPIKFTKSQYMGASQKHIASKEQQKQSNLGTSSAIYRQINPEDPQGKVKRSMKSSNKIESTLHSGGINQQASDNPLLPEKGTNCKVHFEKNTNELQPADEMTRQPSKVTNGLLDSNFEVQQTEVVKDSTGMLIPVASEFKGWRQLQGIQEENQVPNGNQPIESIQEEVPALMHSTDSVTF